MKLRTIIAVLALGSLAPAGAQQVPFPAGTFDDSAAWTASGNGASVSGGVGTIAPLAAGTGTLTADSGASFVPSSLYEVSLDITSSSLLSVGRTVGVEVLDGGGQVVASLSGDQLLNALGINLLNIGTLAGDLNLLDGALTDDLLVIGTLRDLLESLLDVDGSLLDPTLFAAIQELLDSVAGADASLLALVAELLNEALGGSIANPGGGLPLDLNDLLNGGAGLDLIADILELDLLDPGDAAIAAELQDLLGFLLVPGNEGPVEKLVDVIAALLGNPGDIDLVAELLATLLGEQDLVAGVLNVLNLELIEGDLLGSLADLELRELLGILDTSSSSTQTAKLLFTTGAPAPAGTLKVRVSAGVTLGLGDAVEFDNIVLRQFSLVPTPGIPGLPGTPGTPGAPGGTNVLAARPVVKPKQPRVIRRISRPRVAIRGTAVAYGPGNSIARVFVKVKGKGTSSRDRKFKKVKGLERWTARVRVPVSTRTRVIFYARDAKGLKSRQQHVRVSRSL